MLAGVCALGVGELVPCLRDLPADPALRAGQGEQAEERDEREHGVPGQEDEDSTCPLQGGFGCQECMGGARCGS